jgi:hypothetical protein
LFKGLARVSGTSQVRRLTKRKVGLNQEWFEMTDIRRRKLDDAVWIPLRANHPITVGKDGYVGYRCELFATGSIAVPLEKKTQAETLGWGDIGLGRSHKGGFDRNRYIPADIFEDSRIGQAVPLALEQQGNREEPRVWHLHQDLVLTLGLLREGDTWKALEEGYVDVARLQKDANGEPLLLEIRAEYLKDYLCARGMALYVSSYRSREEVVDDSSHITWTENPLCVDQEGGDRWEGRQSEIHEGGRPFGESIRVVQVTRTDVDFGEDIPRIGLDGGTESNSWTKKFQGRKLHKIWGELWRNEWVQPSQHSPRVRGDKLPPSVFFITDSSGARESYETLTGGRRWLWFRPGVIIELAHRRGGALYWYTRDTGGIRCSPDCSVAFGMNKLGLVNIYAKDIALLPEWQQRLWAGFNVGPEGGVSQELLASQAQGVPADTHAPEEFLPKAIELLNKIADQKLGFQLFREHEQFESIISRTHRFRSVDRAGFFSLAKDLARLTADSVDASGLQRIAVPPKGEKWGSLKTLEKVLALQVDSTRAHSLLGPLHGIYNLRQADAHLPGTELDTAFGLVGVDQKLPLVLQGCQMLHSCVSCLYAIAKELNELNVKSVPQE